MGVMMISYRRNHDGGRVLTALVRDTNPAGNPWGAPFYRSYTFYGYGKSEATAEYLQHLADNGLVIADD